jgi:hypothetical protein
MIHLSNNTVSGMHDRPSHQILHVLEQLAKIVLFRTNCVLLQWRSAVVSGAFLHSPGAVHVSTRDTV